MHISRLSLVPILALLAACGGGQTPSAPPAESSAPPPPPPAAEAPADAVAPAEAAAPEGGAAPAEGAAPAAAAPAAGNAELAAAIAGADLNKGKVLFLQCRACHSLLPDSEPGKIGPTLHNVVGRKAGAVAGFAYSDVVAKSGITWSVDEISHWLERPSDYLPGNKMVFVGLKNLQDRANVIAFIQQESAKPAP